MSTSKQTSPQLAATGWFTELEGPWGQVPVQFTGQLTSGEYVYFRARGTKISLEVFASKDAYEADENPTAVYSKEMTAEEAVPKAMADSDPETLNLGTGVLPVEACVSLIMEWLETHLRHQEQADSVDREVAPFADLLALGSMVTDCPYRYRPELDD